METTKICSYCRESFKKDEEMIRPCECGTLYHELCLEYYTWQDENNHSSIICHTCKTHYKREFKNAWYSRLYHIMNFWNHHFYYIYFFVSLLFPCLFGISSGSFENALLISTRTVVTFNNLSWILLLLLNYCWNFNIKKSSKHYLYSGFSFVIQWLLFIPRIDWLEWSLVSLSSILYSKTKPKIVNIDSI